MNERRERRLLLVRETRFPRAKLWELFKDPQTTRSTLSTVISNKTSIESEIILQTIVTGTHPAVLAVDLCFDSTDPHTVVAAAIDHSIRGIPLSTEQIRKTIEAIDQLDDFDPDQDPFEES